MTPDLSSTQLLQALKEEIKDLQKETDQLVTDIKEELSIPQSEPQHESREA